MHLSQLHIAPFLFSLALLLYVVVAQNNDDTYHSHSTTKNGRKYTTTSYFAMCLVVKNERDLPEWIEYHKRMGCAKFYIFDHNSSVPMIGSIFNYVSSGLVEYSFILDPQKPNTQLYVYNKCLQDHGDKHQFIGFLDSDEFIVVKNTSMKIPDVLKEYEHYGGLTLNWKVFGSSGHVHRPVGGVLPNYYKCSNNFHVKSIVNPRFAVGPDGDPHSFRYKFGHFTVDTSFKRSKAPFNPGKQITPPTYLFETMYINHYNTKSAEDFLEKTARGKADFNGGGTPRTFKYFEIVNSQAVHNCSMLRMPADSDRFVRTFR